MIEFRFKPKGKTLRQYMASRSRVTFIRGPLGSGKTFASCMRVFSQITSIQPGADGVRRSRWVAVRNTYPDLTGTTIKDWMELFGDPAMGKLNMDFPPTHKMDFELDDGTKVVAELVFMALDRPDSVRKLRGMQVTGFWLNEVKELEEDIVDMCDLRHGRYPNRREIGDYWHGMIGDTNAPDDDHWYYRKAEIDKPEGWRFLVQPGGLLRVKTPQGFVWRENPDAENLENLPPGYYIQGAQGKKEPWIRVNLANEYGHVTSGKPIYEFDWADSIHVAEFPIGFVKGAGDLYMGVDFGMTPAVVIGQLVGAQLRILDEIIAEGMGIETFMRDFVTPYIHQTYKVPLDSIICCCDPSGADPRDTTSSSPIEIMQEMGYMAEPAGSNKPEARWEAVRYFLNRIVAGQPAFKLSPTCDTLRKGFNGGYQLRRMQVSGQARYSDKADKNNFSHPHDAAQYLCMAAKGGYDFTGKAPSATMNGQKYYASKAGY